MSFTPLMMKIVAALVDDLPAGPRVVELGNQTFDPTLGGLVTRAEDDLFPLILDFLDRRGRPFDRERLLWLKSLDVAAQRPHTATYYRALGFARYEAIDVNTLYGSLIMDLNVDLSEAYGYRETFDLVTNNGTGEHVFNQYAVFKNMHQLAADGGVLLFVLPFYNWMNHGFFNFNPLLFTDLATANDYEILRLSVGCALGQEVTAQGARVGDHEMRPSWQASTPPLTLGDFQSRGSIKPRTLRNQIGALLHGRLGGDQASPLPGVVEALASRVANISVIAGLRKRGDRPFVMPLQGMYAGENIEDEELRRQYAP